MRYKSVDDLLPGDRIGEDIVTDSGIVLLVNGFSLTERSIEGLKAKGIWQVLIDDEISKGVMPSQPVSKIIEKNVMDALKKLDIEQVQQQAKAMVEELMNYSGNIVDFSVIKSLDEYTYQHSYSVGCLSAMVGMASGRFNMNELRNLTTSGLLHDVGKRSIPQEILNAPRKLSEMEFMLIKEHPTFGYNLLRDNYELSSTVKVAVLQHHENEDGTGYPQGLDGAKIHPFSKIVHIADVFDALTSNRSYREPMSRSDALKYVAENTNSMFSKTYTKIFNAIVVPYPTGSTVRLSDGREAVIVKNDVRALYNPYLRVEGTNEDVPLTDTGCTILD